MLVLSDHIMLSAKVILEASVAAPDLLIAG